MAQRKKQWRCLLRVAETHPGAAPIYDYSIPGWPSSGAGWNGRSEIREQARTTQNVLDLILSRQMVRREKWWLTIPISFVANFNA